MPRIIQEEADDLGVKAFAFRDQAHRPADQDDADDTEQVDRPAREYRQNFPPRRCRAPSQ